MASGDTRAREAGSFTQLVNGNIPNNFYHRHEFKGKMETYTHIEVSEKWLIPEKKKRGAFSKGVIGI